MKNVVKVCLFVFVSGVFLLLLSGYTHAAEKGKFPGHGQSISVISEYKVYPDDVEHHTMALTMRKDKWSSDVQIAGLSVNDARIIVRSLDDYLASGGSNRGQITATFKNGDNFFLSLKAQQKLLLLRVSLLKSPMKGNGLLLVEQESLRG